VQKKLADVFVDEPIERLIGENAYNSDRLDREPAESGVHMIAPHRCNRKNRTQDGAPSTGTAADERLSGFSRGFKTSAA